MEWGGYSLWPRSAPGGGLSAIRRGHLQNMFQVSGTWGLGNGIWDLGPRTRVHTWNLGPGTWCLVSCSWYPEPGAWTMGSGIWVLGTGTIPGAWCPGHGAWEQVPDIRNQVPGQWDVGSGTSDPVPYLQPCHRDLGSATWALGPRARHLLEHGTCDLNPEPGIRYLGPLSWDMGP